MDVIIYEYSFLSCDDGLFLAPYSPTSQILDLNDDIAQYDFNGDSSTPNSGPIDEGASPAIEDVEIVDFNTTDKPRLDHPYQLMRGTASSIYLDHTWISLHGHMRICQALIPIYFNIIYLSCHISGQLNRS